MPMTNIHERLWCIARLDDTIGRSKWREKILRMYHKSTSDYTLKLHIVIAIVE